MVELEFQQRLASLYSEQAASPLRKQAWERFCALGLPKGRGGAFQYVPLRALYSHAPAPMSSTPPKGALSLEEALKTYGAYFKGRWSRMLKSERDPFAALNGALYGDGHFLYIPPKTRSEVPLEGSSSRLHVVVGAGAEVTLKLSHEGEGWLSTYIDISVEEGARCTLKTVHKGLSEAFVLDNVRATVAKDGHFKAVHVTDGGKCVRRDAHVQLVGEGAETELLGAWELHESRQAHHNVLVEHVAPHCRSTQLFKGVLHDASRSSFEGKIYVHREAQKTDAFQLNKNLLTSDRAVACAKPNLEIFADDVKASHGATTGQFEPEELFYLRSRGLPDAEARQLLIEAFLKEVTDQC